MAQNGYTPIQHYRTSTASAVPTAGNLADGEFALNLTDEKLYFKNASGVVKLLASSGGASGSVTSVDASGGTTGLTFSGGPITSSGTLTLGGTLGVANGGTGVTSLTSGYLLKGNGTSAVSASTIYDTGTNVGIGTSSPASKLQVQQTTDGEIARLQRSGGPNIPILKFSLSEAANVATIEETGANAGALAFSTGAAERLYIASNGYVGVGTTTPSATLDVAGTGRFSGTLSVGETLSTGQGVSTGDATVEVGGLRTGSGVAYIDMHSTASSDFETRIIRYAGANGALDIINLGTGAMSLAQIGVAPLLLKTNDTERVRVTGAGDVGIGTSSPSSKLDVAGTVTATAFSGAGTGLTGTAVSLTAGTANAVANAVTFAASGGAAAGTTFNGSAARTVDYSTVGAPKADGTGASGTWGINISGNAASATNATSLNGQAASYYTDITARLGYTPVQQGGGVGQGSNKVYIGWRGADLGLQIDTTNYGALWPISVSGAAANLVTTNYSIVESGGYIYIKNGTTNICRIDSSGNAVFRGNVTGNDTSI